MIFGLFRKYRLPTFPPEAPAVFQRLCDEIPAEDLDAVRKELERCVSELKAEVRAGRFTHHEQIVDELASVSFFLLSRYAELSSRQRKLVVGAIRYFAIGEDSLSDTHFATGFNDDVKVMNYVLEELGIHDKYIVL